MSATACPIPDGALLNKYRDSSDPKFAGSYVDCYSTFIHQPVTLADYVLAFYCTPIFKVERFILKQLLSKPSTDEQARQVATGSINAFAAWTVEQRVDNQLLMCDFQGRTRSWFMMKPDTDNPNTTRLWFGSAVVPKRNQTSGKSGMGNGFNLLLGFHKLYSVVLLNSAKKRLAQ